MARRKSRTKQKRIKAHSAEAQAILVKISEEAKQKPMALVAGAFGDMEECAGVVEGDVITPPDGGTFIKFYGCSYLFKGYPLRHVVEGLGLGKVFISAIPRQIVSKSFLIGFALALLAIFSKKRAIHYCRVYFASLWFHTVGKAGIAEERYNRQAREIRRAVHFIVQAEYLELKREHSKKELPLTNYNLQMVYERELCDLVTCVGEFVALFIEYDNAYRFRLADVLPLLNKQNVRDNVRKELLRIMDILIKRDRDIPDKWRDLKRVLMVFLFISPLLRKWVRRFLLELDTEAMGLDEADKYFCLRRRGYMFGGIPLATRLKERKRIDKVKGHIKVNVKEQPHPDGKPRYEITITPMWQTVEKKKKEKVSVQANEVPREEVSLDQLLQP